MDAQHNENEHRANDCPCASSPNLENKENNDVIPSPASPSSSSAPSSSSPPISLLSSSPSHQIGSNHVKHHHHVHSPASSPPPLLSKPEHADEVEKNEKPLLRVVPSVSDFSEEPSMLFAPTQHDRRISQQRLDKIIQSVDEERLETLKKTFEETHKSPLISSSSSVMEPISAFDLSDICPTICEAVSSIARDDFTECFTSKSVPVWNYNPVLFICWILGIGFRYLFLFPLRMTIFLFGTSAFLVSLATLLCFKDSQRKQESISNLICWWAKVWLLACGGVIRYKGSFPRRAPNQIFVANHSSIMDFTVMTAYRPFASVGQKHGGAVGFLQTKIIPALKNIWFERFEEKDRKMVAQRIKQHIADPSNPPLLLFPEGVCVNNTAVIMFKQGSFALDATIVPVSIKYNKMFADPYWNSRKESFPKHFLRLMTSWCLVADVHFLPPQTIQPNEDPIQFAARVKSMIAAKSRLKNLNLDGYFKYYSPGPRFLQERQRLFADFLLKKYQGAFSSASPSASTVPGAPSSASPLLGPREATGLKARKPFQSELKKEVSHVS